MDISSFKSALVGGGARPNQFRVNLIFPLVIPNAALAGRASNFLCEGAQLPGSVLGVTRAMYRGRVIPMAGDRQFMPWTVTIVNDTQFTLRNALESWSHYINNVRDNTGVIDPNLYSVTLSVDHLDRNDNVLKTYELVGAWPVQVDPINLQFGDNDSLERFSATFEYINYDSPDLS